MKNKKTYLIIGGVALAGGLIYWLRKKEKAAAAEATPTGLEPPAYGPSTHYAIPYGEGGGGSIGGIGGGPPSSPAPGVTTSPEPEHSHIPNCDRNPSNNKEINCKPETRSGEGLSHTGCHTLESGQVICT